MSKRKREKVTNRTVDKLKKKKTRSNIPNKGCGIYDKEYFKRNHLSDKEFKILIGNLYKTLCLIQDDGDHKVNNNEVFKKIFNDIYTKYVKKFEQRILNNSTGYVRSGFRKKIIRCDSFSKMKKEFLKDLNYGFKEEDWVRGEILKIDNHKKCCLCF